MRPSRSTTVGGRRSTARRSSRPTFGAPSAFPEKLRAAARLVADAADENVPAEAIAAQVGLSVSRLQHLFKQHLGTSMRTYRTWRRFQGVSRAIAGGSAFTDAAIAAGFFDAPHFNNAFRQAFGVTPSFVFAGEVRIAVVDREELQPWG